MAHGLGSDKFEIWIKISFARINQRRIYCQQKSQHRSQPANPPPRKVVILSAAKDPDDLRSNTAVRTFFPNNSYISLLPGGPPQYLKPRFSHKQWVPHPSRLYFTRWVGCTKLVPQAAVLAVAVVLAVVLVVACKAPKARPIPALGVAQGAHPPSQQRAEGPTYIRPITPRPIERRPRS